MRLITPKCQGLRVAESIDPPLSSTIGSRYLFNISLTLITFSYHTYAVHSRMPPFLVVNKSITRETCFSATQLEVFVKCPCCSQVTDLYIIFCNSFCSQWQLPHSRGPRVRTLTWSLSSLSRLKKRKAQGLFKESCHILAGFCSLSYTMGHNGSAVPAWVEFALALYRSWIRFFPIPLFLVMCRLGSAWKPPARLGFFRPRLASRFGPA